MIAGEYFMYLFSIIVYPKCKLLFQSPNPLETGNRLLKQLQNDTSSQTNPTRAALYTEQSYQRIDPDLENDHDDILPSPFDSRVFLSSKPSQCQLPLPTLNKTNDFNDIDTNTNTNNSGLLDNINNTSTNNSDLEYYQHRASRSNLNKSR